MLQTPQFSRYFDTWIQFPSLARKAFWELALVHASAFITKSLQMPDSRGELNRSMQRRFVARAKSEPKIPPGISSQSRILRRRLLPDLVRMVGLRGLQFEMTGKRPGGNMRFPRQPRGAAC